MLYQTIEILQIFDTYCFLIVHRLVQRSIRKAGETHRLLETRFLSKTTATSLPKENKYASCCSEILFKIGQVSYSTS